MGMTPEGKVKKKLERMLKGYEQYGLWSFPPQAGAFGSAGIPDRIVCANGKFIGIEAKATAKFKPTALQQQCMDKIEAAGGKCFVVYDDETIERVREYLETC